MQATTTTAPTTTTAAPYVELERHCCNAFTDYHDVDEEFTLYQSWDPRCGGLFGVIQGCGGDPTTAKDADVNTGDTWDPRCGGLFGGGLLGCGGDPTTAAPATAAPATTAAPNGGILGFGLFGRK